MHEAPLLHPEIAPPGFIFFAITEDCIFRCKNCYKWRNDRKVRQWTRPPTPEQWRQTVRDIASFCIEGTSVHIAGGEVLLHERVLDIVHTATQAGLRPTIATNGYLIDEKKSREIAEANLPLIVISLDGATEKTHDYLRGVRGAYRQVLRAVGLLQRYSPRTEIIIQTVMYDINKHELIDLTKFVREQGIGKIVFLAAMQPNNTPLEDRWWEGRYGYLWPRNSEDMINIIDELIELKQHGYPITNSISQFRAFQMYYRSPETFVKKRHCNLERGVLISAVGDIFLCFELNAYLGNIRTTKISEAWRNHHAESLRKKIRKCKKNCHILLNCFDEFAEDFPQK